MTRAELLRDVVTDGRRHGNARLYELAAELDLPASDLFVLAGRPAPARLLPPARDPGVMRGFAYRATYCDHARLAALRDFVSDLASADPASTPVLSLPESSAPSPPEPSVGPSGPDRFPEILAGLMRNRGFGMRQLPFTGLSISTIRGMLRGRWHNLQQLKAMAGPLGWRLDDLAAVAGEPLGRFNDCSTLCHHVGQVYVAAIPLPTAQLIRAGGEADRLSQRQDHGAWRPVAPNIESCPEDGGRRRNG